MQSKIFAQQSHMRRRQFQAHVRRAPRRYFHMDPFFLQLNRLSVTGLTRHRSDPPRAAAFGTRIPRGKNENRYTAVSVAIRSSGPHPFSLVRSARRSRSFIRRASDSNAASESTLSSMLGTIRGTAAPSVRFSKEYRRLVSARVPDPSDAGAHR
jgi:hypothetical protein